MNKKIIIVLVFLISLINVYGTSITINGNISSNTTWNTDTVFIDGDITIDTAATLTIEPGTYVIFQGHFNMLVTGRLLAVGTVGDSITFSINDTTGFMDTSMVNGGWKGITFNNASSDTSKIVYSKIHYGKSILSDTIIENVGGAIIIAETDEVIVSHCNISYNAAYFGGGILCYFCNPVISNNLIKYNYAVMGPGEDGGGGGAISLVNASPFIADNRIHHNVAFEDGGGIEIDASNPVVKNNIISYNEAFEEGGGIDCDSSNSLIFGNSISFNSADYGAGIYIGDYAAPKVVNNKITNNLAYLDGGGINYYNNCQGYLNGNLICNNEASANGGGIYLNDNSAPSINNNSITKNQATNFGGGICISQLSSPNIQNSIIWSNNANEGKEIYLFDNGSDPNISYCDIKGGETSIIGNVGVMFEGDYIYNMDTNPLFINPTSGYGNGYDGMAADWNLDNNSPLINAGNPDTTSLYMPLQDIDGGPRIYDYAVDIGAFENTSILLSPEICLVTVDTSTKKNMIVWEKSSGNTIDYYKVYKLTGSYYDSIGWVDYDSLSLFIDQTSNPKVHADKYKISLVDTLGQESVLGAFHQTMNLSKVRGASQSELTLIWNKYIEESGAFLIDYYYIYRGMDSANLQIYDSITGGLSSYNYNIYDGQDNEYFQVIIKKGTPCDPNLKKASAGPFSQSLSNLEDNRLKEDNIHNCEANKMHILTYPNPANDIVKIDIKLNITSDLVIKVKNMIDQTLYTNKLSNIKTYTGTIDVSNWPAGLYLMQVMSGEGMRTVKLMVE